MRRIAALLAKDLAELRHSPGIFVPAVLTGFASVVYPFVIAIVIPYFAGERLSDSSDFEIAAEMYRTQSGTRTLSAGRRDSGVHLSARPHPDGRPDHGHRVDVGCGAQRHRRKAGARARTAAGNAAEDRRAARQRR